MRKVMIGLLLVTCCGCAGKQWAHQSKNLAAFYADNSRCEAMSYSVGSGGQMFVGGSFAQGYNFGSALRARMDQDRIYEQCMFGNGWYYVSAR